MDIAVIILPVFMLKDLSMQSKKKWGLITLFGFGILYATISFFSISQEQQANESSTCVAGLMKVVCLIKQNLYAETAEG